MNIQHRFPLLISVLLLLASAATAQVPDVGLHAARVAIAPPQHPSSTNREGITGDRMAPDGTSRNEFVLGGLFGMVEAGDRFAMYGIEADYRIRLYGYRAGTDPTGPATLSFSLRPSIGAGNMICLAVTAEAMLLDHIFGGLGAAWQDFGSGTTSSHGAGRDIWRSSTLQRCPAWHWSAGVRVWILEIEFMRRHPFNDSMLYEHQLGSTPEISRTYRHTVTSIRFGTRIGM